MIEGIVSIISALIIFLLIVYSLSVYICNNFTDEEIEHFIKNLNRQL